MVKDTSNKEKSKKRKLAVHSHLPPLFTKEHQTSLFQTQFHQTSLFQTQFQNKIIRFEIQETERRNKHSLKMKGRKCKEAPSTDLLVCFPSRAHLTLMPSPATHHHHLKRCNTRGIGAAGQASPMLWKRTEISEPTSPKVTCAGQIKVRHKPKSCKMKNWQSVMEDIEKLHVKKHKKKKTVWMEAVGFKKDAMQFLTCLRNIRFDFRCFGSSHTDITTDDDDDDDDEDEEDEEEIRENDDEASRTVFSKWFMVLQENQKREYMTKTEETEYSVFGHDDGPSCAPPPNALLLMRCRSAPAKGLLEQNKDDEQKNEKSRNDELEDAKTNNKLKSLVVMRYGSDFYKFSSKDNWVVGGNKDSILRSRSSKR